jgi:thiol-disulfide isomerase/thioredoxin
MKNIVLTTIIVLSLFLLTGCVDKTTDAYKFKEEYESINNEDNGHGNKYRELNIPTANPIIYQTTSDIVKRVENKETFIVYFGFKECPWCRSVITELINVAKDKGIDTIYYVDVKDIRDVKQIDENNNIITVQEGDKDYLTLIEQFSNVLSDYTLTKDNEKIDTGEKRIYAPNVIVVSHGTAVQMEEGIPESLTNPYAKLTDKQKKEIYNKFKCIMTCYEEEQTTCRKDMC